MHVVSGRYNIRYGRSTATDEEVENAAVIADIHSRILGFPEGNVAARWHFEECWVLHPTRH